MVRPLPAEACPQAAGRLGHIPVRHLILQRDFGLRLRDCADSAVNMGKSTGFKRMYESELDFDCLCGVTTTVLRWTVRKVSL